MRDTGPGPAVRGLVAQRAGHRCEVCGGGKTFDVHHRHPRKMGGTRAPWVNSVTNLLLLCRGCHRRAEEDREWGYSTGVLVQTGSDPEDVPFTVWWSFVPVWLGRNGEYRQTAPLHGGPGVVVAAVEDSGQDAGG